MEIKVRMTHELFNLVNSASAHIGYSPSFVMRRCINGYISGRAVAPFVINETCYKSGPVVFTVKKVSKKIETGDDLRRFIARRCLEVLSCPKKIYKSYAAEAGISSRPPDTLEEAEQMACYYDE